MIHTVPELQEKFVRPKQPKLSGEEYQDRTAAFWEEVRPEVQWWTKELGSAVGSTMFWQLAETQWHWDVIVKGWEPSRLDMDRLHWEASLMNELDGRDGYWVQDHSVTVLTLDHMAPEEPFETDKSWVRDTSVDADGNAPY